MNAFMFVLSCLSYFFIVACMTFVITECEDYPIGSIFAAITVIILELFVKPLLYIWFFNLFIAPLLPFELIVPYWNMVAICFFGSFLSWRTKTTKK